MDSTSSQQKVQEAVASAVATLCKRMLHFNCGIRVEGLLGITLDAKTVLLVNILEEVRGSGSGSTLCGLPMSDPKDLEINAENAAFLEKLLSQPRDADVNFESENWNTDLDMKLPENILAELLDKVPGDKCDLFAEEPKKKGKRKKKAKQDVSVDAIKEELPVDTPSPDTNNIASDRSIINSRDDKLMSLGVTDGENSQNSQKSNGFSQSLRYLGEQDSFLPLNSDDPTLDYFPVDSSSPNLDCNGTLDITDLHKPTSDPFDKYDANLTNMTQTNISLKAEAQLQQGDAILDNLDSESTFTVGGMDLDFDDASTTTGDKFPCSHCGVVFSHKRSLWRHKQKHKNETNEWSCDICSQTFSRKDILLRHRNQHKSKRGKSSKCPFCKKLFSRLDSIQRHISLNHNDKILSSDLSSVR